VLASIAGKVKVREAKEGANRKKALWPVVAASQCQRSFSDFNHCTSFSSVCVHSRVECGACSPNDKRKSPTVASTVLSPSPNIQKQRLRTSLSQGRTQPARPPANTHVHTRTPFGLEKHRQLSVMIDGKVQTSSWE